MKPGITNQVTTPTRADLAGGTLDIWPLYTLVTAPKTINVALDLRSEVTIHIARSRFFEIDIGPFDGVPFRFSKPLTGQELSAVDASCRLAVFVASHFIREMVKHPCGRLTIRYRVSVPQGSGLGGSTSLVTAITCALGSCVRRFTKKTQNWELAAWVRDVEAGYLKTLTGSQDSLAAIFGGLCSYSYGMGIISQHRYSRQAFLGLKKRLLILFSGDEHHSGASNWEIIKKALEGNADTCGGLKAIAGITNTMHENLSGANIDWGVIGKQMSAEWDIRRSVFDVDTPRLNTVVTFVRNQDGVLGCKVCGAATGGSIVALVEPEKRAEIEALCKKQQITVLNTQATEQGVVVKRIKSSGD